MTWRSIETAPKDGTAILYGTQGMAYVSMGRWTEAGWFEINLDDSDLHGHPDYPTHWMPLPEPPKDGD